MLLTVRCQHAQGTCLSHFCPVLSLRKALQNYAELSHSTLPFLALRFYEKDLLPTPRLLQVRPILPLLGIFFQSPQDYLGDMGQSNDIVSLLFWEVIIDVMDNSTYKLAAFGATRVLVRKSARFSPALMCVSRVSPIATNSQIAW
jgi:hypothetical protein